MIRLQKNYKTINLIVLLGMSGAIISLFAQTPESKRDADQIASLMSALSDRSKVPSDVLDPMLSPADRVKNLKRFSTSRYELNLVPTQPVQILTEDLASVQIRVHYASDDGARLDTNATAHFVKRSGTWYFSDFKFMEWPAFLIVVLVVGVLIAIGYATTVLVLRNRLVKKGQLGGRNLVKVFLPVFWPDLFRQTR